MDHLIEKYFSEIDLSKSNNCDKITDGATSCIDCCGKQYFNENEIDYSCEQKRKVYVLRYLPVHYKEMYLAASRIPQNILQSLFGYKSINVLSLGGGPGSDVAAIKQKLIDTNADEIKLDVNILRVDIISDWDHLAPDIIHIPRDKTITFNHSKRNCNLAREILPKRSFHLITLSYLISEIGFDDIPYLITNIKNSLAEKSVILINDRNEEVVIKKIESLLSGLDAKNVIMGTESVWCSFSYPEHIKTSMHPKLSTSSIRYTIVC